MAMIFIGAILLIFAVILFIVILSLRNGEKGFRDNFVEYNAVVVGYVRQDYTKWDIPQVSIEKANDTIVYRCKSKRMNATTHPRGTRIKVAYYKKRVLGTDFYDVRLIGIENEPHPMSITQAILTALTLTFLTVAGFLVIIGIRSI